MGKPSHVVIGLHFGDEGKGTIVDALVRKTGASTVVRFNGGAQAAHNVVTPQGVHHTFSQWGSGTLAGADTILSDKVIVDPLAMSFEARHLANKCGVPRPFDRLLVDERALVVTPFHAALNQIREYARGAAAHGTCGVGIGEVMADATDGRLKDEDLIRMSDLSDADAVEWKARALAMEKAAVAMRLLKFDIPDHLARAWTLLNGSRSEELYEKVIASLVVAGQNIKTAKWDQIATTLADGNVVFEGAQGVLLDEWYGFHPHTTWSTTTSENAVEMLAAVDAPDPVVIGVTRAYFTRHGAGPFPSGMGIPVPDGEHNNDKGRQGKFRVGGFDAVLARYALDVDRKVKRLAVTCCDHPPIPTVTAYSLDETPTIDRMTAFRKRDLKRQSLRGQLIAEATVTRVPAWSPDDISRELKIPLSVKSHGPKSDQKEWL